MKSSLILRFRFRNMVNNETSLSPWLRTSMTILSCYFPTGLAKIIKKTVTIKPKVVANSLYMVTLGADGIATIIDFDEEKPIIVKIVRHIHDIFNTLDNYSFIFFVTNTGDIHSINNANDVELLTSTDNLDDIHITARDDISLRTNIKGEVEILSDDIFKIDFPEPVVATAVTLKSILFLTVSGTVRIYHTNVPHFAELTSQFREAMGEEVNLRNVITRDLDSVEFHDVVKIIATDKIVAVLKLNNEVLYTEGWTNENTGLSKINDNVIDIDLTPDGPLLELLPDGRVRSDRELIPHIKDIIAISSSANQALINANGQVLVKHYGADEPIFTTIPRLRLTVK